MCLTSKRDFRLGNSDTHFDCPGAEELERDAAWWEIYRDSFPANEQEPEAVVVGSLVNGAGLAFRARQEQTTIGIATTHLLHQPAAAFLVYLAIDRGHQDAGLGGVLLEHVWTSSMEQLRARGLDPVGMVWEVAADSSGERRISFFRRHGGVLLPVRYFQPPVDGVAAVPMQLMFRPCAQMPDAIATDALVRSMYFEKYGAMNGIAGEVLTKLLSQA